MKKAYGSAPGGGDQERLPEFLKPYPAEEMDACDVTSIVDSIATKQVGPSLISIVGLNRGLRHKSPLTGFCKAEEA